MAISWQLTIDCASPGRLARFWAEALGYTDALAPEGYESWPDWFRALEVAEDEWDDGAYLVDPEGRLPGLSLLKVPESKTAKNRVHLDLQVSGGRDVDDALRATRIETTVDRLLGVGASVLQQVQTPGGELDHVVLADPEGNELCVV